MPHVTRRSFLQAGAAATVLAGLAGCSTDGESQAPSAPDAASYPIEPEEWGSGSPKWEEAETADGWTMPAGAPRIPLTFAVVARRPA